MQILTGAPGSTPEGLSKAGNPFMGIPGTVITPETINSLLLEMKTAIEGSGQPLDPKRFDQLKVAIEMLSGMAGGQVGAISQAGLAHPIPTWQRDSPHPIVLCSIGLQRNPDSGIHAGWTSGPPISSPKNTVEDNGYDGGATYNEQPGHAWPYQTFGGQMKGNSSVASGYFPGCWLDEGINHYFYPNWVTPAGMLGIGGGRIRIQMDGSVSIQSGAAEDYQIEVILGRQLVGAWNSGSGGEGSVVGGFTTNRTISLLSPVLSGPTLAGTGSKNLQIVIDCVAVFKRVLVGTVRWLVGAQDATPVFDETRPWTYTGPGTLNFADTLTKWTLLFKIDANTGGFPQRVINNTPFGGGGSTPPKAAQDGSKFRLRMDGMTAVFTPGV